MKVTFWGVRGSIPAPGPETVRYGGNTLCVEVVSGGGQRVILDAGTGLVVLDNKLIADRFGRGEGEAVIMLSHAHMDHIQGFPFFAPIYVPGNRFVIYGRERAPGRLEEIFEGQMNPHFSPVHSLKNLGATFSFTALTAGEEHKVADLKVRSHTNPHGSTTALAFRLEEAGRVLVCASDVGYGTDEVPPEAVAFYQGADMLIHDCTYSPEDFVERANRGFSSIDHAVGAAVAAGVSHLVMIHYDQDYTDEDVDALAVECRRLLDQRGGANIALTAAAEGMTLDV